MKIHNAHNTHNIHNPSAAASPKRLDVQALHAAHIERFTAELKRSRYWYVLPTGEADSTKAQHFYDTHSGFIFPTAAVRALGAFREKHNFSHLQPIGTNKKLATLHSATGLLWNNETSKCIAGKCITSTSGIFGSLSRVRMSLESEIEKFLSNAQSIVQKGRWAGLAGWQLPDRDQQLRPFATAPNNPHRAGPEYRLATKNGDESQFWMTNTGRCYVDNGRWGIDNGSAFIFACNPFFSGKTDADIVLDLLEKQWQLRGTDNAVFDLYSDSDTRLQNLPPYDVLRALRAEDLELCAFNKSSTPRLRPRDFLIIEQLACLDYTPCRLPELDNAQLSDPEKGLWELWGCDAQVLKQLGLVARDPGRDVCERAVAIDFGTSSTVVAVDTPTGRRELLRIGVRDFLQDLRPADFENPTVLECLNWKEFHAVWTRDTCCPDLNWEWMRAAHEAQTNWRDNPGDTTVLASILPRLKQWALRTNEHRRIRLTDRQGYELEIPVHSERNPVRGQPLRVRPEDPFDPIELYAWYLGRAINWRGRGLYLKYCLSFPVKYPLEAKNCILSSFRRGLLRSLPATLIEHHPDVLNHFSVEDLASEPAAYAAAALVHLDIQPTQEGVPYAVFDFGGGTSDFDFGLLRWATEQEEMQGYERVFEHLTSEGDKFLGGENLLEHLVYASFYQNLRVLREHRIQFVMPMDATPFAGSEAFIASTQAAQTNTIMLAAKLRPFMEGECAKLEGSGTIKCDLINANGQKKTCELILDAEKLDHLLAQRIRKGVEAFLTCLVRVQEELPIGEAVHVLLAGNGCHSRHIRSLFDPEQEHWPELLQAAFGHMEPPTIVIHPPLPMDAQSPHAPTAKTGVALGLLRVMPGENTLLINHVHAAHDGQAPFGWFVGRMRRGGFMPCIEPGAKYGAWHEVGPLQAQVFNLLCSSSLRARTGLREGDPELCKRHLSFAGALPGERLYARAVGPNQLELATGQSEQDLIENPKRILDLSK